GSVSCASTQSTPGNPSTKCRQVPPASHRSSVQPSPSSVQATPDEAGRQLGPQQAPPSQTSPVASGADSITPSPQSVSYAPMSHRPPCGRGTPRWSVVAQAPSALPGGAGLPALIAGLPARSAWFGVGPPLAGGGASRGSCPTRLPAESPPSLQPARSPKRL